MNKRIEQLKKECYISIIDRQGDNEYDLEKFAELIIKECIGIIEDHRIPLGNSAVGELACEWTYEALQIIKDNIKDHFEN
jgi:ethanolamine ammonia-lyase large subunit